MLVINYIFYNDVNLNKILKLIKYILYDIEIYIQSIPAQVFIKRLFNLSQNHIIFSTFCMVASKLSTMFNSDDISCSFLESSRYNIVHNIDQELLFVSQSNCYAFDVIILNSTYFYCYFPTWRISISRKTLQFYDHRKRGA